MALNLLVRGGADFSGIQREMARTQRTMSAFQTNVSGIMKKVGFAFAGIGISKIVKDSLGAASELEGAMMGLSSIIEGQGRNFAKANAFIQEYIKDGLVPLTDAVTTYKNLASRGYNDEQIQITMSRLKDSASFGRQASLSLGEAVRSASEGLKNENSILVDNAGVTKNVAKMWDEYAKSIGKSRNDLTQQEKIQAEVNGIMNETQFQVGDAAKYTTTYAGRVAALNKTLRDVKVNLGNAFMPIANIILPLLQTLANGLARITAIFAQFSKALFGKANVSKQAKDTTKQAVAVGDLGDATEEAGKQAKKAQGSLAGFDEINSLSDSASSGTDGDSAAGGIGSNIDVPEIPEVDTSGVDEISTKVKEMADKVKSAISDVVRFLSENKDIIISVVGGIAGAFALIEFGGLLSQLPLLASAIGALFSPMLLIGAGIATLIGSFIYLYRTNEDFRNSINDVWTDISKTMNSIVNDTLKPIFNYMINDFLAPIGKAFKDYILPVLAELFIGIGKILNDILKLLQSTIDNVWDIVKPGLDLVKTIIIDVLEIIKKLWDKYGNDLIENVREFIQGLQETFQLIWDNIIDPIIKPALEMLTWLWEKHLKGLVEQIGEFIMKCVNGALEIYNGFIKPIADYLIITLGPAFSNTVNFIIDLFGTFIAFMSDNVKALLKMLGGIVDFIVGVLTGNWKKAWQGLVDVFKGIVEMISGIFKGVLNLTIDVINAAIRGIVNSINGLVQKAIALANSVPGINISFSALEAPQIPKLAKGGITNGPMHAIIGDNPGGREVVSPLGDLMDMIASAVGSAMMAANQFSGGSSQSKSGGDIYIQMDGYTLIRAINPYQASEQSRLGSSTIIQTT